MTLEQRVKNLEKNLDALIRQINKNNFYTNADILGVRQSIGNMEKTSFPDWIPKGFRYYPGERVSYNANLYRCIQDHISQAEWTPDLAVSLWTPISDPSEEWPEWKQPAGAHDAYNKGDKVSHLEKHWISDIDANVYEPSVYGWSEI